MIRLQQAYVPSYDPVSNFLILYQALMFDFLQANKRFKRPLHVPDVFLKEGHSRWRLLQFIKPEGIRVIWPYYSTSFISSAYIVLNSVLLFHAATHD